MITRKRTSNHSLRIAQGISVAPEFQERQPERDLDEFIPFYNVAGLSSSNFHHPSVQSDLKKLLSNEFNTMYFGELYVGNPEQKVQVIFDTGSDWLVLEAKECSNCLKNSYDAHLSETFERVDDDLVEHIYGTAQLYGLDARDDVSLDKEGRVKVIMFEFFEVFKQYGITENVDGILGMCRPWVDESYQTGPLFVVELYKRGAIAKNMFSFYIDGMDGQSFIDFGYYDEANFLGGST